MCSVTQCPMLLGKQFSMHRPITLVIEISNVVFECVRACVRASVRPCVRPCVRMCEWMFVGAIV